MTSDHVDSFYWCFSIRILTIKPKDVRDGLISLHFMMDYNLYTNSNELMTYLYPFVNIDSRLRCCNANDLQDVYIFDTALIPADVQHETLTLSQLAYQRPSWKHLQVFTRMRELHEMYYTTTDETDSTNDTDWWLTDGKRWFLMTFQKDFPTVSFTKALTLPDFFEPDSTLICDEPLTESIKSKLKRMTSPARIAHKIENRVRYKSDSRMQLDLGKPLSQEELIDTLVDCITHL